MDTLYEEGLSFTQAIVSGCTHRMLLESGVMTYLRLLRGGKWTQAYTNDNSCGKTKVLFKEVLFKDVDWRSWVEAPEPINRTQYNVCEDVKYEYKISHYAYGKICSEYSDVSFGYIKDAIRFAKYLEETDEVLIKKHGHVEVVLVTSKIIPEFIR